VSALRVGVIGCGFFAQNQLNAWAEIDGVEIAAVCDRQRDKAEAAAARFGGAVHTDAQAMLAGERLDFVDIATTVESHRALVELAARHGLAAICQKPFAETLEDGEAMVEACRAAGVPLMVHENFRWQRPMREAKRLLEEGAIGAPFYADINFRHRFDVYARQPYLAEVERLSIMDVGLHLFDLARFFLGEVTSLHCRTQRLNPRVRGEDSFFTSFRHASGAVSACTSSFYSLRHPDPFPQTLGRIEGSDGSIDILQDYRVVLHQPGGSRVIDADPPVPAWGERPWHVVQESVGTIQRHWVECLRTGREPETSGADNLRTLRLAVLAYESAAEDRAIAL